MDEIHFEELYPEDARYSEIEEIKRFLQEGNSCQLLGLPGVGKANILGLLVHNKQVRQKHFGDKDVFAHFVLVNFSEMRNRALFDVMKFLFLSLVDSLRERKMTEEYEKVNALFKEGISFQDELVLFQYMKQSIDFLAIEKRLSIIFLFDRFDEYIPFVTSAFFTNLRVLRDRAKYRLAAVFSVNRPLEDVLEPTILADYYEFVAGHTVFVGLYDKPILDFRLSYLEKITERTIDKEHLEMLLPLTGGHWRLTRICAESLLSTEHSDEIETYLLSQKTVKEALSKIWRSFSPAEQDLLISIITGEERKEIVDDSEYAYLERVGVTQNGEVQIKLLKPYLEMIKETTITEIEPITFDSTNNTISKGNIVLSDRLTPSEYRLLSYLISNAERVIEREELISVVWSDARSTAGVTDQAVDQLLFRLRKKIEDDPNNPHHIQTVKGRGIKFSA